MASSNLPPIAGTIRNQVYQVLKQNICSGSYQPGQWLQEQELAAQLGVSRSPVREALKQLVSDGLLVEIPNKGVFVKAFTAKDIEEIFDVRLMMESYAILHCRRELLSHHSDTLQQLMSEMAACHSNDDLTRYITLDNELHLLLVVLCGNDLLLESYQRISAMIQQFRIYSLTGRQRFDESVDEHDSMVRAIMGGALGDADAVNHKHLTLAKEKILLHLRNTGMLEA